jgi:tRNA-dihydrouridine synthase
MLEHTGSFGVLAGRATEGNPLFFGNNLLQNQEGVVEGFRPSSSDLTPTLSSTGEGVAQYNLPAIMLEHAELFIKNKPDPRAFVQMRKNFGWYTGTMSTNVQNSNLSQSEKEEAIRKLKELRIKLVRVSSLEELKSAILKD